jgi:hypothetical protein
MKNDRGMIDDTYHDSDVWKLFSTIFENVILFVKKRKKQTPINPKALLELKESVKNIQMIAVTNSDANNDWIKHSNSMTYNTLNGDLNIFLRWPSVRDTMNVTNSKFILYELNYLKKLNSWKEFWKKLIVEPWIGGQIPFILYPKSSGNSIHLAYVMARFMEKTGKSFEDFDFIFEFGGGYGNLCRLIHGTGFTGKYTIYDLPIISALQRYYLSSVNLKLKRIGMDIADDETYCDSNSNELIAFLEEAIPIDNSRNLFIATWSLSESPMNTRTKFEKIMEKFDYFLMGYQDKFGEVDNKEYFNKIKKSRKDIEWYDWPIKYLPAHNFLIGKKKT